MVVVDVLVDERCQTFRERELKPDTILDIVLREDKP